MSIGGNAYQLTLSSTATAVTLNIAAGAAWAGFVAGTPDWSTAADWTANPNYPHNAGDTATFGSLIGTNNQTVNLTCQRLGRFDHF